MKKLIIICLIYANAYSQNINSLLNEAIENSDLIAVAQIFELNQFSEKEKYMYLEYASNMHNRRYDNIILENLSPSEEVGIKISLALLSTFIFSVSILNQNERSSAFNPIISVLSGISTLIFIKSALNAKNKIEALNKQLCQNALEIKQLITLSINESLK